MKLGNPTYTSPRATGTPKKGFGGNGSVNLPQHGGEGTDTYKGQKSDTSLPQHGGEGTSIKKGGSGGLLKPDASYRGPGANLGK